MSSLKAVLFDMDDTLLDWSRRSGDWASHERAHLQHVFDYVVETIQPIFSPVADFFDEVRRISRQAWLFLGRRGWTPNTPITPLTMGRRCSWRLI